MPHLELYIDITENKGRGIFTMHPITADTIVETAPVIVMSDQDRKHLDETLLHDYIFEWLPDEDKRCCMALGWVPVYNHSYSSNCEYFMNYDSDTIEVKTVRDIAAGEELTINYNGDWNNADPVWFDVNP